MPLTCLIVVMFTMLPRWVALAQNMESASSRTDVPDWSKIDTSEIFFEDVFRDAFDGQWPPELLADPESPIATESVVAASRSKRQFAWSRAVSDELLIDEIKRINIELNRNTRTKSSFDRYGSDQARANLTILAVIFRVISEWDGEIRFQADSRQISRFLTDEIRQMTAANSFEIARTVSAQLSDMVAGNHFAAVQHPEPAREDWQRYVDRSELMIRLESAIETNVDGGLQSAASMKAQQHDLCREVNLATALFGAMCRPGALDAEDWRYVEYCKSAARQTIHLRSAIAGNRLEEARHSLENLRQSCVDCHDQFR